MRNLAIDRQELARRQARLSDLQATLSEQEQAHRKLHEQVQAFVDRYSDLLGPLYMELDALESQLHTAMVYLHEALQRNGVSAHEPIPPKASALPPMLARLPAGAPLPAQPAGGLQDLAPPSLKQLYRRAAMRFHPDLAGSTVERQRRESQMMTVNKAYEQQDRAQLEQLLIAAGEAPERVTGNNSLAMLEWLQRCEQAVRGRLRVVQAHQAALLAHPMHRLWAAIVQAEAKGLDPMGVMASRLRSQIVERRRELYIGQRLQPDSGLAQNFLHQRRLRVMGTAA
ncbi:MAG: J domain-containing protein [Roseateles asaccharophilus]|uniref:J domain-containing protein n=1 Tax=Roseateles asaccharophilus TaxID=582607 RepID=UPI00391AA442